MVELHREGPAPTACAAGLFLKEILNLKGHPNRITGSKVTAILLNGWILPVGGVASGRVCAQPAKQACLRRIRQF